MQRRNNNDYVKRENVIDKFRNREDNINVTKTEFGLRELINGYYENKGAVIKSIICCFFASVMLVSWIIQLIKKALGEQDTIYVSGLFTEWFSIIGIIAVLFLTVTFSLMIYRFFKINKRDYYYDKEKNINISTKGAYKAHWQTEEERDECFIRDKNIENITGDILGIDDKGRLYTLRDDLVGINRNKCIFGTPGSGKSAAIIENDIIQCMRRGESAIITDSKGDLYRKLSRKARDAGYTVRVLNLKSNELKNSDSYHLLKYLEDGDTSVAEMLANCIIENTGDGHMDYWAQNEMNGYKALLLYISTNAALKKAGRNTLAEMYNICTQNNPAQLAALFNNLPKTHPAKQAFNIYANCEPKVQGQILNGMGIKLSFLTDQNAQQIVSHDEIDLIEPMKTPCMYFVVIPDTNKTYNVIANLFFNMMLIKQCEYSDSLSDEERKKQLYVNYILDEFKATGAINNFDGTITTVRSRKIAITTVLQTLGQLQDMYPGMAYDTILGSMTTKILLRAGDEATSKYFQMICGKQTIMNKSARYSDTLAEAIHTHNSETITEGLQDADLLPVDEAQKMNANKLIVCILGFEPVKLNKYLSFKNPYLQEWDEAIPGRHLPLWRQRLEEENKKNETNEEFEDETIQTEDGRTVDVSTGEIIEDNKPEDNNTEPAFPTKPQTSQSNTNSGRKTFRRIQLMTEEEASNNNALNKF